MQTRIDRARKVRAMLYQYQRFVKRKAAYTVRAMGQTGRHDESGIRGTYKSDPTARGGCMLADPPHRLAREWEWIDAINDAWAECMYLDKTAGREGNGLAYTIERLFCLTGEPRPKEKNSEAVREIAEACGISERTVYDWRDYITGIVEFHAGKRALL